MDPEFEVGKSLDYSGAVRHGTPGRRVFGELRYGEWNELNPMIHGESFYAISPYRRLVEYSSAAPGPFGGAEKVGKSTVVLVGQGQRIKQS